jgi:hypothetical protein
MIDELEDHGGIVGANHSRLLLGNQLFVSGEAWGASSIQTHEGLRLKTTRLAVKKNVGGWEDTFATYAAMSVHGILVLLGNLDDFRTWVARRRESIYDELDGVPDGRLFVSINYKGAQYILGICHDTTIPAASVEEGEGFIVWANGDTFEGGLKDGKRHGKGKFTCAENGCEHNGSWKHNKMSGLGTKIIPGGKSSRYAALDVGCEGESCVYFGGWKYDQMHGQGRLVFPSGEIHEGAWKSGQMHGRGKKSFANGTFAQGEWKNGLLNGQATKTYADGSMFNGDWENDRRHGKGRLTYANKTVHDGSWHDDEMHGYGKYTYADGRCSFGKF